MDANSSTAQIPLDNISGHVQGNAHGGGANAMKRTNRERDCGQVDVIDSASDGGRGIYQLPHNAAKNRTSQHTPAQKFSTCTSRAQANIANKASIRIRTL